MPKQIDPGNLTPFGEVFWDIAEKRGITSQSAVERHLTERGRKVSQRSVGRYTSKGKSPSSSSRPTAKFAKDLVIGLELDLAEQVELAWAALYGERMPRGLMDRLEAFEDFYRRFVEGNEQSHSTSSTTTSEIRETQG